jgi:uncharacterized membrane protein
VAEQKSRTTRRKASDGARAADKPRPQRATKGSAGNSAESEPPDAPEPDVGEAEPEAPEPVAEGAALETAGSREKTLREELRSVIREAALEVLSPVARRATAAAAQYAVANAPKLAKDTVAPRVMDSLAPRIEEAGGAGPLAKGALTKVSGVGGGVLSKVGLGGGEDVRATGKARRLPVQASVDVAVPLEAAYDQFTRFEEFPEFMHRVEKVEQLDDTHLVWHDSIWGVRREWEAEILEQQPNERIVWESLSGVETTGVVTFHRLSDRLTRIEVSVDTRPERLLQKTASGLRISKRGLKSDLMRFKAFVEMGEQETGAWRGREVADERGAEDDGKTRREEPEDEGEGLVATEPAAEPDEEDEGEPEAADRELEEPEFEEEPEDEHEEEAEQEPESEPVRPRRRVRRRAPAQGRR